MQTGADDTTDDQEQPTKDRPFNPFRTPRTSKAKSIVADVLGQVQSFERYKDLRKRKRRATDQQTFEETVAAVVCDLMHRFITCPEGWVSVPLSNQYLGRAGRYRAPAMNKALPDILDRLSSPEMAFVVMEKGYQGHFGPSRRTVLRDGSRLMSRIQEHGIQVDDLGQTKSQEVIYLKREKTDFWDEGGLIDYADTATTKQYRSEVQTINAWLASADIVFDTSILNDDSPMVDDTDRLLRRYFTKASFEKGGRLFGGFWQPLPKWQRSKGILIEGEDVTSLDFAQMAPRILYGLAGEPVPEHDAYHLPELENHRKGVKKVMNALLFAEKPLTRFPKDTRKLFPSRTTIKEVLEKLEHVHAPIKHFFYTGIGHKAQFIESEIMVDILLALKQHGIIGLPIHDAVIVPSSAISTATTIMLNAFHDHTGTLGIVDIEGE